jgi:hypothetical protein
VVMEGRLRHPTRIHHNKASASLSPFEPMLG